MHLVYIKGVQPSRGSDSPPTTEWNGMGQSGMLRTSNREKPVMVRLYTLPFARCVVAL